MDELIKMVMNQTKLDEKTAKQVVTLVVNALKDKLPAPLAKDLEGVLAGKVDPSALLKGDTKGIVGTLMGMFKKK